MNNNLKEAMFYDKLEKDMVICLLCPHNCKISNEARGICGARANYEGKLYSLNYGKVSAIALDPIEKKPLYRFRPGTMILSAGSFGCNFRCPFCQNYSIARSKLEDVNTIDVSSDELVAKALELKASGNIGVAFTYNEPTVWYEYVYETFLKTKEAGLKNILVTNGYINKEPLMKILPLVDAMNIDLKAFSEEFYKNIVFGDLSSVKQTIELSNSMCHVELTTLVIPDLNDSVAEIESMAKWIASLSETIPLHLSRFFPNYEMRDKKSTSVEKLNELKEVAEKYLKYVYIGNV